MSDSARPVRGQREARRWTLVRTGVDSPGIGLSARVADGPVPDRGERVEVVEAAEVESLRSALERIEEVSRLERDRGSAATQMGSLARSALAESADLQGKIGDSN